MKHPLEKVCNLLCYETLTSADRWLSATQSLGEQDFKTEGWLILYPVAALAYRVLL